LIISIKGFADYDPRREAARSAEMGQGMGHSAPGELEAPISGARDQHQLIDLGGVVLSMHTGWTIYIPFWFAVGLGIFSQGCNYYSTFGNQRTLRKLGFWLGLSGTIVAGGTAYKAAVDWNTLPLSSQGLGPGELYDNRGEPAIVESNERVARIKQINEQIIEHLRQSH
jgi:hypothetical protein